MITPEKVSIYVIGDARVKLFLSGCISSLASSRGWSLEPITTSMSNITVRLQFVYPVQDVVLSRTSFFVTCLCFFTQMSKSLIVLLFILFNILYSFGGDYCSAEFFFLHLLRIQIVFSLHSYHGTKSLSLDRCDII